MFCRCGIIGLALMESLMQWERQEASGRIPDMAGT